MTDEDGADGGTADRTATGKDGRERTADTNKETATAADAAATAGDGAVTCIVCTEPIHMFAVGPCNHRQVCHLCSLRLRAFYRRDECSLCKAPQPTVAFTTDGTTLYAELAKKHWPLYHPLHILCETDHVRDTVRSLLQFRCVVCDHTASEKPAAMRHLRDTHPTLQFCQVCFAHRKVFFHEHKLYTRSELAHHVREGDRDDPAFHGHVECRFCNRLYYSADELYTHLEQDHFHCFLCRHTGIFDVYYATYETLGRGQPFQCDHFDTDHYLCHHPDCRNAFVAFASEFALKAHDLNMGRTVPQVEEHGKDRKIARQDRIVPHTELGFFNSTASNLPDRPGGSSGAAGSAGDDARRRPGSSRGGRGRSGDGVGPSAASAGSGRPPAAPRQPHVVADAVRPTAAAATAPPRRPVAGPPAGARPARVPSPGIAASTVSAAPMSGPADVVLELDEAELAKAAAEGLLRHVDGVDGLVLALDDVRMEQAHERELNRERNERHRAPLSGAAARASVARPTLSREGPGTSAPASIASSASAASRAPPGFGQLTPAAQPDDAPRPSDLRRRAPPGFGTLTTPSAPAVPTPTATATATPTHAAVSLQPPPAATSKAAPAPSVAPGASLVPSPARSRTGSSDNADPLTQRRQREFLQQVYAAMGNSDERVNHFRSISRAYRSGSVSADEFYRYWVEHLGPAGPGLFSQLVDLIPDEDLRVGLLTAHNDHKARAAAEPAPTAASGPVPYTKTAAAAAAGPTRARVLVIKARPKGGASASASALAAAAVPGSLASILTDVTGDQRRLQQAQYSSCPVCGVAVALRDLDWHAASHYAARAEAAADDSDDSNEVDEDDARAPVAARAPPGMSAPRKTAAPRDPAPEQARLPATVPVTASSAGPGSAPATSSAPASAAAAAASNRATPWASGGGSSSLSLADPSAWPPTPTPTPTASERPAQLAGRWQGAASLASPSSQTFPSLAESTGLAPPRSATSSAASGRSSTPAASAPSAWANDGGRSSAINEATASTSAATAAAAGNQRRKGNKGVVLLHFG